MASKHSMKLHNFIEQEVSTGGLPEEAAMDCWQFMAWRFADRLVTERRWIAEHQGYLTTGLIGAEALAVSSPKHTWCNATCTQDCTVDHDKMRFGYFVREWRSVVALEAWDLEEVEGTEVEFHFRIDTVKQDCISLAEYHTERDSIILNSGYYV